MERGSFNSCFDKAQWKLAEHAVWANTWEQEATLGCPKGQRSRFEGSPVAFIGLRRRYRAANRLRWCAARRLEVAPLGPGFRECARPLGARSKRPECGPGLRCSAKFHFCGNQAPMPPQRSTQRDYGVEFEQGFCALPPSPCAPEEHAQHRRIGFAVRAAALGAVDFLPGGTQ